MDSLSSGFVVIELRSGAGQDIRCLATSAAFFSGLLASVGPPTGNARTLYMFPLMLESSGARMGDAVDHQATPLSGPRDLASATQHLKSPIVLTGDHE